MVSRAVVKLEPEKQAEDGEGGEGGEEEPEPVKARGVGVGDFGVESCCWLDPTIGVFVGDRCRCCCWLDPAGSRDGEDEALAGMEGRKILGDA